MANTIIGSSIVIDGEITGDECRQTGDPFVTWTQIGPDISGGFPYEFDEICENPMPATFKNTVEALERHGLLLDRVCAIFFNRAGSDTNETVQGIEREIAPRLTALHTKHMTDPRIFARIEAAQRGQIQQLALSEEGRMQGLGDHGPDHSIWQISPPDFIAIFQVAVDSAQDMDAWPHRCQQQPSLPPKPQILLSGNQMVSG